MPDLVDAAQGEVQQLTQRVAMNAATGGIRISSSVAKAGVGHGMALLGGLLTAARSALDEFRSTGKVSLKELAGTGSARQLVDVADKLVARELERTLKRYGVTFAVEAARDGSRTFHVQGKDVQVVERALSKAAERIDDRIAKNRTRSTVNTRIDNRLKASTDPKPTRTTKRDQKITPTIPGSDEGRTDRPAPRR
ncbi:DUF3801 domain-containing protein [Clavibacter michiganensis]|uniref:DUF3801 domain-containing protein n=1 Tax=Clavibacter michiganensis TaxID=28447 RepID=UPI00292CF6E7|nr:DUF3801 domain-containing protein [Clavibacter michiganensis]